MNSDWDTLYLLVNLSNKKYGVFFVVVVVLFFVKLLRKIPVSG